MPMPIPQECTATEDHRHACEVRHVAALPSNGDRKRYLDGVENFRGAAAANRLRVDAWQLMTGEK